MNRKDIFTDSAFEKIPDKVKNDMLALADSLKGKSVQEAVPYLAVFMQSLPKGYVLSRTEKEAMIAAVSRDMGDGERKKLYKIITPFL